MALGVKARAASAGVRRIRIVEAKTSVVEAFDPIDFHSEKVESMPTIHQNSQLSERKKLVVRLLLIEAKNVAKAATATTFHSHAQAIV